jgi:hypothetical protein
MSLEQEIFLVVPTEELGVGVQWQWYNATSKFEISATAYPNLDIKSLIKRSWNAQKD